MTAPAKIEIPRGCVIVTTYGQIQGETVNCLLEARSHSEQAGMAAHWGTVNGTLVTKARNDSVRLMLSNQHNGWLVFLDGDMTFEPDIVLRLLNTAYVTHPWADAVGAYCNLRGDLALPTIDSGTGTWESHAPHSGVIEVMRTGAAAILIKRHVFERMRQPWFATRVPVRYLDALAEIDNLCRIKFDGRNPFRHLPGTPWEALEEHAMNDPQAAQFVPIEVGEDSGFCDAMRNLGMRIVVDTSIVTGHVDRRILGYAQHKEALEKQRTMLRQAVGVLAA